MDIANPELKQRLKRRRIMAAGGVGALAVAVAVGIAGMSRGIPTADRDDVWVDTAAVADVVREARAPGKLVPRDFRWLAAESTGQVQRIEVLPGTRVTADTVLMRLANPEVEDNLRAAQSQVAAAEAQVGAKRTDLRSQLLTARSAFAQAQADYAAAKVRAEADSKAVEKNIIPRVQYQQSMIALEQYQYRVTVERERVAQFESGMKSQMDGVEAALAQQRSTLILRQRQFDGLQVRAGIDGVLQEVPVQEGQQVAAGANLARVARPDVLIARLLVPETQAKDVALGMEATIDTYNGVAQGKVSRIDPAVADGAVRVDVELVGDLPPGARPDLAVDGRIRIATMRNVLSIRRPAKALADASNSLFVIAVDAGDVARRVPVRLGALSVERAQVLEGLKAGDKAIVSDASQWDKYDRIRVR
ncbi:efflux RND transporter periplasmic adaptor subunit [Tahibacter soli]|jgi:multidrug efflux pump subunit AcrA (membrane-fusion protein)|uniref:HlyD family efflux transporter periplasmic adaptor subunit n=1 Tax=Tahibacter soli TaxID=2983605 RepID=A0A9X3YTT0_9GAMM|nr:HlyD family efflux transporter periplasmic adaptor subunit [Tahibacter soli]MDC8016141.1 HlyD family efflux transporter periplasmic adaptor subunit [Tahibacter soli]